MTDETTPQEENEPETAESSETEPEAAESSQPEPEAVEDEPVADVPQASPAAETTSPKKSRSPVEKMIVWGGIAVLVLLVAFQAQARIGYSSSVSNMKAAMKAMEAGGDDLTLDGAKKIMKGMWTKSEGKAQGSTRPVVFKWKGLQTYTLTVNVETLEGDPLVLSISTDDVDHAQILAEAKPKARPRSGNGDDDDADEDDEADPPEGSVGGPGGGGNFDPFQLDKDGDEKISLEEASDQLKERFPDIDTNSDDFIDKEEWENRTRRGPRGGGEGGRGGEEGGRPKRPARPDTADATDSGDTEPAEGKKPEEEKGADDKKPDTDEKEKRDSDS